MPRQACGRWKTNTKGMGQVIEVGMGKSEKRNLKPEGAGGKPMLRAWGRKLNLEVGMRYIEDGKPTLRAWVP
jgi:hypothetical protein